MKSKKAVSVIAVILLYAAVFAGLVYMQKTGRAFIVFGRLIKEFSSLYFLFIIAFIVTVVWVFREKKAPKLKAVIISCIAVSFGPFTDIYDTEFYHGRRIIAETLTLPDGENVLLDEVNDVHSDSFAYIYVYKISGCIAKETGIFNEWGFHGIEQGCWEYTYDEFEKKLTITIEYDTGFWEKEFNLE